MKSKRYIFYRPSEAILSSPIAQLVEQMTVNHRVAGSSPAWGASFNAFSALSGYSAENQNSLI